MQYKNTPYFSDTILPSQIRSENNIVSKILGSINTRIEILVITNRILEYGSRGNGGVKMRLKPRKLGGLEGGWKLTFDLLSFESIGFAF